jgi:hypothetical protein
MLHEFIATHTRRDHHTLSREGGREVDRLSADADADHGVPVFLEQLANALRLGLRSNPENCQQRGSTRA